MWLLALAFGLCLGYGAKPAQAAKDYPSTVTLSKLTDTYEAPDLQDPSDVKLTAQEVYITAKNQDSGSIHNWYRIATWRGEKWVRLTEADFYGQEELVAYDVALLADTELYDAPQSGSKSGIRLGSQTVHAEGISGSYLKIGTWLGAKWIRISPDTLLNVQVQEKELSLDAAATPAFAQPDGSSELIAELSPQIVEAFEQKDSWYHIRTIGGTAWINPDIAVPANVSKFEDTDSVEQATMLYAYPSFEAKPLGLISPQQVDVDERSGGWRRIHSDWVGEAWLYLVPDPDNYTAPPVRQQSSGNLTWKFRQLEIGAYGSMEYPLNAALQINGPRDAGVRAGTKIEVGVSLTNVSRNGIRFDAPASFAVDIVRLNHEEEQTVWSVRLPATALSMTGNGNYTIDGITWDQTDGNGKQVPQGDYVIRLRAIEPATFFEAGVEGKQTMKFKSYFVTIPIRILLPTTDRESRLVTAQELFQSYLVSLKRSSVPASRRIADYRIKEVRIVRESYDDFTFRVSYEVLPASDGYNAAGNGERQWDGWISNKLHFVHAVRQGDEYRIESMGTSP